jgi:undecaprenyl-diphosphatase
MPSLDAPVPRDLHRRAVTMDAGTLVAGLLAILAGVALAHAPEANLALFRQVNDLGPAAPVLWSCLSVAGLGLAACIYLTAFAQREPARVAQFLWILVVGGTVASLVKHRLRSPRPLLALGDGHLHVIGDALRIQSMPSGHSAMAFAMLALLLAERRRRHERGAPEGWPASRAGLAAVALFAAAIALSRIAVGAHWPADVLVGSGLGLVFGAIAPHAWPVGALARGLARPAGQRAWAVLLLGCAAWIGLTPTLLQALGLQGTKLARDAATGNPLGEPLQVALALLALAGAVRWWRAGRRAAADVA